ncbi:MAG: hypothetical protein AB9907_08575 [Flexilinea sp.]
MARKDSFKTAGSGANFGIDPEALDFSNETWSWKGEIPNYPIQSDGFSYDVIDEDGNDKTALSLGILGMIIIVFNTKGPKIKEEDIQPAFKQVAATRNWHILPEKEVNFLSKTAIKKLTDTETSSDVFDLASYAPLEVKRALLKKLFVAARYRMKPEFTEEAERRIVEDIVPLIFSNPQFELAQLTGLIIKPKVEEVQIPVEDTPAIETPVIDLQIEFDGPKPDAEMALQDQLESLRQDVPAPAAVSTREEPETPVYVPFSDMENGSNQELVEPQIPGYDSVPYQQQFAPMNQPRPEVPRPNMPNVAKPPVPPVPAGAYPVPPVPPVPQYGYQNQPFPQPNVPQPGYYQPQNQSGGFGAYPQNRQSFPGNVYPQQPEQPNQNPAPIEHTQPKKVKKS